MTESEKKILVDDITSFLSSSSAAASDAEPLPVLQDLCKVPIFKLVASIVDSSALGLEELTEKCQKVVVHSLKQLLEQENSGLATSQNLEKIDSIFGKKESDGTTSAASSCRSLIPDLIKINAERRQYGFRAPRQVPSAQAPKDGSDGGSPLDELAFGTVGSLEVWELTNASHFYLSAARCKELQQL